MSVAKHSIPFYLVQCLTLSATLSAACSLKTAATNPSNARPLAENTAIPQAGAAAAAPGMQMVHGSVFDASDGVTPIAGGQVTPVYDCADACDMSQAIPGADGTQAVALSNGQFLFLQKDARLTGYYITVPGYQALFVPRSFRNPAPAVTYALANADGGLPDEPPEEEVPPGNEPPEEEVPPGNEPPEEVPPGNEPPEEEVPPGNDPWPEEEVPPASEPAPGDELPLDAGAWPEETVPPDNVPPDGPGGLDASTFDAGELGVGAPTDAGAAGAWGQEEAYVDAGALVAGDASLSALDGAVLGSTDASMSAAEAMMKSRMAAEPPKDVDLPPVFLCPEGAADTDKDGVCDKAEMKYTTDPASGDSDGDFLSDNSELYGYREEGKLLDLPRLGANPKHRDVFLYVDFYPKLAPAKAAISQVVSAFAAAPYKNLDGKSGIALHVKIAGKAIDPGDAAPVLDLKGLGQLRIKYFDKLMLTYAYHYVVFANRVESATSKVSGLSPATEAAAEFIVSLGGWTPSGGTAFQQAGTLMHELGHNLGLDHGGYTYANTPAGDVTSDETTDKPHYLSIMNYAYQTDGFTRSGKRSIDYARHPVGPLSERAVSEPAALNPPDETAKAGLKTYTNLRICTRQLEVVGEPGTFYCDRYARIRRGNAASDLDWNRNRRLDKAAMHLDLDGDAKDDDWKGIADDWTRLKYFGLPRTGDRARIVTIGDAPARKCMRPPTVEEEPEPAAP